MSSICIASRAEFLPCGSGRWMRRTDVAGYVMECLDIFDGSSVRIKQR